MPKCVILSDDMIDLSRIGGHARALGLDVSLARNQSQALTHLQDQPAAVLVDLHQQTLDPVQLVERMHTVSPATKLIGYGSHVDVDRLKKARAAGLTLVLPRSAFFHDLDGNLSQWCGLIASAPMSAVTESH